MTFIEIFILSVIQGLTEFLPVSSSAHLVLPSKLLGWNDQGLAFDVAVHVGTLLAVCVYFKRDLGQIINAWFYSIVKKNRTLESDLGWWVIFATIPAGLFGFFGKEFVELYLRHPLVISASTIVFGLLLGFSDKVAKQNVSIDKLGLKGALIVGFAQVLALVPGTSRSGITITAGLLIGLSKSDAARFSFLLSIPLITMAGGYLSLKVMTEQPHFLWFDVLIGASISFCSALMCISVFMKVIEKMGMRPFVIYRLCLGVMLCAVFW